MENKKKMNVWIIPSFYWSEDYPLRGIFFKEQAEAIQNEGINVTVIYPELRSLFDFSFSNVLKYHFQKLERDEKGLHVIRKRRWNFFKTNETYSFGYKIWKNSVLQIVQELIEKNGTPDLIHAHNVLCAGIVASEIKKKWNVPYIITEHSTMFYSGFKKSDGLLYKSAYLNANMVVAVSSDLASTINESLSTHIHIITIPNFIDTKLFDIKLQNKHKGNFTFFTLSHLIIRKKVDKIIQSFANLLLSYPENEFKLVIGGQGEEKVILQKQVKELKIESNVEFIGIVNRPQAVELFNNADAFVLASNHETFGVVLIEAMACGVPIIATKSGGPLDIVEDKCGILVDKDIKSITDGMEYIFLNQHKYSKTEIRQIALDKFSNESIASKYKKTYESIINSSN